MPLDSDPVTTTVDALRDKQQAAQDNCEVDVAFWGGVIPGNVDELGGLAAAGVPGFKCFLTDSGNPNFPHLNADEFRHAVSRIAALDAVLLVHAESHDVIEDSPRPCGRSYASYLSSRPEASEEDAVALVIAAARETGARVHIVHVSSARVLPMLADAKRSGVRITAETCPHYLTFAAEDIPDGATQFAVCPPIRDGDNRGSLWQGLADGTLDMVVSDHSPCAPSMKAGGDFGRVFGEPVPSRSRRGPCGHTPPSGVSAFRSCAGGCPNSRPPSRAWATGDEQRSGAERICAPSIPTVSRPCTPGR
jgi:allantoinase